MEAALPCLPPCAAAPSSAHGTERDVLGLAWNVAGVSFPVAYDFLASEDVNKDKIQDILFLYKNTNSSRGNSSLSCADEGTFYFYPKASAPCRRRRGPLACSGFGGGSWRKSWTCPHRPLPV